MLRDSFLGFVRHALTTAGGYFMGAGMVSDNEMQTIVAGIVTVVGVVWSVAEKKMRAG